MRSRKIGVPLGKIFASLRRAVQASKPWTGFGKIHRVAVFDATSYIGELEVFF
jgi:hypothetical protein